MMRFRDMLCLSAMVASIGVTSVTAQTKEEQTPSQALQSYEARKAAEVKILSALKASDIRRKKLGENIANIRKSLGVKSLKLNQLANQRRTLESELAPLERKVRERLKARQVSLKRGEAFLRLLLQEGGATKFMTARGYLNAVAALDLKVMQDYELRKRTLVNNEKEIQQSTISLRSLELKLAKKAVEIDTINAERFVLLENAKREKRKAEDTAIQLGLTKEILSDEVQDEVFLRNKGEMVRPSKASLIRTYGNYVDPRFKTTHRSDGFWFEAKRTSDVFAIAAGRVIYSGLFDGYGQLIVVEHTPRFHSLYGFVDELAVALNAEVKAGMTIGKIRKSSRNHRPRLYFEIRKGKAPQNPRLYLAPQ